MIRRISYLFATILGIAFAVGGSRVSATNTVPTDFLLDPPILITGYAWENGVFSYIQLYNNSDTVQRVTDWLYTAQDAVGGRVEFVISGAETGWLAPHTHVVASYDNSVTGASLSIGQVALPSLTQTTKAKLIVAPKQTGYYRESEYVLSSGVNTIWQRNFSSTGQGYVSTFTGSISAPLGLFDDGLYTIPAEPNIRVVEVYPYSSDCAPTDTSVLCGDYVKLYVGDTYADYARYVLRTDSNSSSRTTSNTFYLADYPISSDGFVTISVDAEGKKLSITNSGGYMWLEDIYGVVPIYTATMTQYVAAGESEQGFSWAFDDTGSWQWSTTPRPGEVNTITPPIEQVVTCSAGKYLNPETGRCRTIEEAVNALTVCPEGQYRNPTTNRCRQIVSTTSAVLAPCGEGQERNPATNRCRSIASAVAELIPCDEGYERNPATNRCRKVGAVLAASDTSVNESISTQQPDALTAWGWALAGVAGAGAVGYGVYEWRPEIARGWKTLKSRVGRK